MPKSLKNYTEIHIKPKNKIIKIKEVEEEKRPKYNNSLENNNNKR